MALIIADRVMESATTTGTGSFALGGAHTGYRAFDDVCANGDTVYYVIEGLDTNGNPNGEWECGLGTFNDTDTLARTTPQASSNAGAAVNFSAGTKRVFLDVTATLASAFYRSGGTDVALADGGTGASLADPGADRVLFWDESANALTWLTMGTNLTITGTTLDASGGGGGGAWQIQWTALQATFPTSNFATIDSRNNHPVLDFDTTTQETAYFSGVLPADYAGGGLTVSIFCAATSATTGTIGWDVAIERMDASSLDIDADSFATAQTVTATTVPGTSGQLLKLSVNIANGADMDSLAAGEAFRLRVRRDVTNDTATGDAELLRVMVVEQ